MGLGRRTGLWREGILPSLSADRRFSAPCAPAHLTGYWLVGLGRWTGPWGKAECLPSKGPSIAKCRFLVWLLHGSSSHMERNCLICIPRQGACETSPTAHRTKDAPLRACGFTILDGTEKQGAVPWRTRSDTTRTSRTSSSTTPARRSRSSRRTRRRRRTTTWTSCRYARSSCRSASAATGESWTCRSWSSGSTDAATRCCSRSRRSPTPTASRRAGSRTTASTSPN